MLFYHSTRNLTKIENGTRIYGIYDFYEKSYPGTGNIAEGLGTLFLKFLKCSEFNDLLENLRR